MNQAVIVHRYSWPIHEAVEHMLGDAAGDAQSWKLRVEGDELVIDIVAPSIAPATEGIASPAPVSDTVVEVLNQNEVFDLVEQEKNSKFSDQSERIDTTNETAKSNEAESPAELSTASLLSEEPQSQPEAAPSSQEPKLELKGGAISQRAAINCGERGFWTFLKKYGAAVTSKEEAAAWLRHFCGIESRRELDHDRAAGDAFKEIDRRYRLWLEGYDDV